MLNKFSEIIRGNLPKMLRLKIVALVTIEIHARDVIEKLAKSNCNDVNGFEWLMQLRIYWDRVKFITIFIIIIIIIIIIFIIIGKRRLFN
jgi:hypothetical protein